MNDSSSIPLGAGAVAAAGDAKSMKATYYKHLGRFDLCSNRSNWQVVLSVGGANISALWGADEEPDIDGAYPSDVLDLIAERITRPGFWCSNRDDLLSRINAMRDQIDEADYAWVRTRLERARDELARWHERLFAVERRKTAASIPMDTASIEQEEMK